MSNVKLDPNLALYKCIEYLATTFKIWSYLEIGTREGDSLERVMNLFNPSVVHIVDEWSYASGGTNRGNHDHIVELIKKNGYDMGKFNFHDMPSTEALPLLQGRFIKSYFNMILVDGDHMWKGVTFDMSYSWHLLRPFGIMVIDDTINSNYSWIRQLKNDFIKRHDPECIEIYCDEVNPVGVSVLMKVVRK